MDEQTRQQCKEIEDEIMEQSRKIVFGERGRRAVNPERNSARIMKRNIKLMKRNIK